MTTIKKIKQRLSKGSVLVFTLLVLFMLLVSALGIAAVTLVERKTSTTTGKSTQSFQVADSGAEVVLQKIYKDDYRNVDDLVTGGGMSCSVINGKATIGGSIALGKDYAITFEDDSNNDIASCNSTTEIRRIKSAGSYAQTTRAVEVAVAQSGTFEMIRGTVNGNGTIREGNGFSSVRNASGEYTITLDTSFTNVPSILITPDDQGYVNAINVTKGQFDVTTRNIGGSKDNRDFHFMAIAEE